ncbi:MAG: hypothetical protein PHD15_07255 [Clostridia bacterium]|nr:hypothetical protein [Clostridia bacterium]MDD4387527.1 hypothetical protein [Clostridia bacterium]
MKFLELMERCLSFLEKKKGTRWDFVSKIISNIIVISCLIVLTILVLVRYFSEKYFKPKFPLNRSIPKDEIQRQKWLKSLRPSVSLWWYEDFCELLSVNDIFLQLGISKEILSNLPNGLYQYNSRNGLEMELTMEQMENNNHPYSGVYGETLNRLQQGKIWFHLESIIELVEDIRNTGHIRVMKAS